MRETAVYHNYHSRTFPDAVREIYLSSRGRLSRHVFAVSVGVFIVFIPASLIGLWKLGDSLPINGKLIAILCLLLLQFYSFFTLIIKRLHDTGHTGFLAIIALIPVLNALFFLYLIFRKGGKTRNRFGHPCPYRPPMFVSVLAYPVFALFTLTHMLVLVHTVQSTSQIVSQGGSVSQSVQGIIDNLPVIARSAVKKLGIRESMAVVLLDKQLVTIGTFITEDRLLVRKQEVKETIQNALAQNKRLQVMNLQGEAFITRLVAFDNSLEVQMAVFEIDHPLGDYYIMDESERNLLEKIHAFE